MKRVISLQIPISTGAKLLRPDQPQESLQMLMVISLTVEEWGNGSLAREIAVHVANKMSLMPHVENFGELCEQVVGLVRDKTDIPVAVGINTPMQMGQVSLSYSVEDDNQPVADNV